MRSITNQRTSKPTNDPPDERKEEVGVAIDSMPGNLLSLISRSERGI